MEQSRLGFKRQIIVTVDTDLVVIILYIYWDLNVTELWIEFGAEKDRRWLPVYSYELLGKRVCRAVIFWFAWTGCDTVSQFLGCGKPTAWKSWKAFPELIDTFIKLSRSAEISTEAIEMIEPFVVLMYDRTYPHKTFKSIYLHRWIIQWTTPHLHEMPCCNTFAGGCHSQIYGRVAWHWTKLIKTWQIQVGLWMTKASSSQYGQHYEKHHKHAKNWKTAPIKGFVSGTVVHAKNTTFYVQICVYRFMSDDFCYIVNLQNIIPGSS